MSTTTKAAEVVTVAEEGFFAIIKWENPYGGDDEYKWTGPFTTRKSCAAAGKRIHDRGPSRFVDWMKCARPVTVSKGVVAFAKAAAKVGMNPNLRELDLRD